MHWFSTQAICSILARFDRVIFIGDSMMRHVAGSFNILMRMDLGHGAVTDWNFSDPERYACSHLGTGGRLTAEQKNVLL